jgi:hypothetical protein
MGCGINEKVKEGVRRRARRAARACSFNRRIIICVLNHQHFSGRRGDVMSEQINAGQTKESETHASGLLLSVEPLQASAQLNASDDNADTGGSGEKDTSDDAGADTDGTDASGSDTDLTDALGADTDGSDAADTDGTDSGSTDSDGSDSGGVLKIDSADA